MAQHLAVLALFEARRYVSRAELDAAIHPDGSPVSRQLRAVLVTRARKLLPPGRHINAIRGVGYRVDGERLGTLPGTTPFRPARLRAPHLREVSGMSIRKGRREWTDEQVAELTAAYVEGLPSDLMSRRLRVSDKAVCEAIERFRLREGETYERRKEGIVRRLWGTRPAMSIAQGHRVRVDEIRAIAKRLGLGPEVPKRVAEPNRREPWPADTLAWAKANPDHPEARIINGEMARRFPKETADAA